MDSTGVDRLAEKETVNQFRLSFDRNLIFTSLNIISITRTSNLLLDKSMDFLPKENSFNLPPNPPFPVPCMITFLRCPTPYILFFNS